MIAPLCDYSVAIVSRDDFACSSLPLRWRCFRAARLPDIVVFAPRRRL